VIFDPVSVFTLTALGPKETEMKIIGCDLHARQQTAAMMDTATGEVAKITLKHGDSGSRATEAET
jgi:hypothetical protein